MIDWKAHADQLLEEYNLCCRARPRDHAVDVQLEKDRVGQFLNHLVTQRSWGTERELAEACLQFEPRLAELKKKLVMEILKNGSV
jgi:hypothetical protein